MRKSRSVTERIRCKSKQFKRFYIHNAWVSIANKHEGKCTDTKVIRIDNSRVKRRKRLDSPFSLTAGRLCAFSLSRWSLTITWNFKELAVLMSRRYFMRLLHITDISDKTELREYFSLFTVTRCLNESWSYAYAFLVIFNCRYILKPTNLTGNPSNKGNLKEYLQVWKYWLDWFTERAVKIRAYGIFW